MRDSEDSTVGNSFSVVLMIALEHPQHQVLGALIARLA
jgi:hypothetical protein